MTVRLDDINRIKQLFGLDEIPAAVEAGWDKLDADRVARSKAGRAIPKGGCFLLGRSSVVAGCMAEMHMELCTLLQLPEESIALELDYSGEDIKPVADIRVPEDWVLPSVSAIKDPEQAVRHYLDDVVEVCRRRFLAKAIERLDRCDSRRVDVDQLLFPAVGNAEKDPS